MCRPVRNTRDKGGEFIFLLASSGPAPTSLTVRASVNGATVNGATVLLDDR